MCCFSRPAKVTDTNIFARASEAGRQLLVYEMQFSAAGELAMILPLPVTPSPTEDAVRFIALDGYRDFFRDLHRSFPIEVSRGAMPAAAPATRAKAPLAVVEVGDFEASFVPSMHDFDRLDDRFRLPIGIWYGLPGYHDFGFAVFKLKAGTRRVHPMAFEFPRRDPSKLFFPTVHIHDGVVHAQADFDHSLYLQGDAPRGWTLSNGPLGWTVDAARAQGIVDGATRGWRVELRGRGANEDIYV